MQFFVGIEGSTAAFSVGVWQGHISDRTLTVEKITECLCPRAHTLSQSILVLLEQAESYLPRGFAELSALILSRGPGSFTGIRLTAAVGQTLAFCDNVPLIGLSSFEILAEGAYRLYQCEEVFVAIDANMHAVYQAHLKKTAAGWVFVAPPETLPSNLVLEKIGSLDKKRVAVAGDAFERLEPFSSLAHSFTHTTAHPQIEDLLTLGAVAYQKKTGIINASEFTPLYLTPKNRWQPRPKP